MSSLFCSVCRSHAQNPVRREPLIIRSGDAQWPKLRPEQPHTGSAIAACTVGNIQVTSLRLPCAKTRTCDWCNWSGEWMCTVLVSIPQRSTHESGTVAQMYTRVRWIHNAGCVVTVPALADVTVGGRWGQRWFYSTYCRVSAVFSMNDLIWGHIDVDCGDRLNP